MPGPSNVETSRAAIWEQVINGRSNAVCLGVSSILWASEDKSDGLLA